MLAIICFSTSKTVPEGSHGCATIDIIVSTDTVKYDSICRLYILPDTIRYDTIFVYNKVSCVEELNAAAKATKALVNGKLIIRRGARTFNAHGTMLK